MNTIVVEDRLTELFATLPDIIVKDVDDNDANFPIRFDFGDTKDFDLYLKDKKSTYPILWLEIGFDELHNISKGEVEVTLSFKIATSALDSTLLNHQRIKSTFGQVLIPTLENVRKAFERANIVQLQSHDWSITKFYNYGDDDGTEQTQIIDALKFDVTLKINNDCLMMFNYG